MSHVLASVNSPLFERNYHSDLIECPKCGAPAGKRCEPDGRNHVERGRQARWKASGLAGND